MMNFAAIVSFCTMRKDQSSPEYYRVPHAIQLLLCISGWSPGTTSRGETRESYRDSRLRTRFSAVAT